MKKHDVFSVLACIPNANFKPFFLLVFLMYAYIGFGQTLLPVYNTDPTIPQAGWAYGSGVTAASGNYDCIGAGSNVIRFNSSVNEFAFVNYATAATNVSFSIQRNSNNAKTLQVEQSVDGITYTTVATVTNAVVTSNNTTYTLNYALNTNSRFVRFNMTASSGGSYLLDAIAVYNTTAPACGCTSFPTSNDGNGITSITVGSATFGVTDVTYYNYVGSIPNLTAGTSITSSITFATGRTYDSHIWIDFNDDGVFDNSTEKVYTGESLATNPTTLNTTFTMPGGATPGQHKMRIGTADSGQGTPTPCYSGSYGVTIELFVNIIASAACTTPLAQPTALVLTPTATSIAGSFTASASANGYLVIRTTTAAAPTNPTSGIAYTAGTTALGGTIVQSSNATTFTDSPLASSTQYWYWIFAYNTGCTGQPAYLTTSPLTNYTTTLTAPLIVPTTGNNSYSACSGTLYDNGGSTGNYANNSNGYTVLNPAIPGNFVEVSGTITTEGGYDYLTIYDGVGTTGTILWGGSVHGTGTSCGTYTVPTITSITGSLTVRFYSDGSNNCSGFALNIACSTTPGTVSYCTPSTANAADIKYIDGVEFIGTLNDISNFNSGWSTTTPGYQDWTALPNSTQQQGEGMNVYVEGDARGHFKAWIDWDNDGQFDDNPANGELVYDSGSIGTTSTTFGYVIPTAQAVGDYRLRIRFYNSFDYYYNPGDYYYESYSYDFDACETFNTNGFYTEYGEAEDYMFTVLPRCDAQITSITNGEACGTNETVDLSVTGSAGVTSFRWYDSKTGGTLLGTTGTGDWTTPNITATTVYWVEAYNGCWSYERERIIAFLNAPATLEFTPTVPLICGENNPPIAIQAISNTQIEYLIDEDFEGSGLGSFTGNNITVNGSPYDGISQWQQRTSTFVPNEQVWFPAISSGFGANKFVMSNADSGTAPTENELVSAVLDASTYLNLTLELDMYFSRYNLTVPENVNIEVSINGGASWNTIDNITNDVGYGTSFDHLTYDLSTYAGESNLRVRVYYYSDWGDGVAIDNIVLYGNNTVSPLATWSTSSSLNVFSDSGGSVAYAGQPATTIYVVPSVADLQSSTTWDFSATVTLANGCSATGTVSLENRTRYFTGITDDWSVATNWKPAYVPTSENCVIIPDTYSGVINGTTDGDALNVTVQNGGTLNIQPKGTLTIVNFSDINPGGTFVIEDDASLIQIDNVTNTGTGDVKRNSEDVRDTDYIYWSSPVDSYDLSGISPGIPYYYRWQWIPTVGSNTNGFGDWTYASGNMALGKGYIVRAGTSNSDSTADTPVNTTFRGVFNNGNISIPIACGIYNGSNYTGPSSTIVTKNDDNWNLIGNPYPSAINAIDFLNANTNIEGAVHVWTHGTQIDPSNAPPFYEDYVYSYNVNDYLTFNASGASSGAGTFNGYIASGQGFFVMMNHGAADTDVNFNNTMRHKSYDNDEFYRTQQTENRNSIERHRIWLSIISPTNQTATSLVGYIEGATLEKDRLFDAYGIENNAMNLFSLIDDERMLIQGRPLPFNNEDQVPIGVVIPVAGNYSIAIHSVDGLFVDETQDIYLEDLELNIIHNLREQPYSFNAVSGVLNNRFVLRYTNNILSVEQYNEIAELSITAPKNNHIKVTSTKDVIKNIEVYDLLGRVIFENKNIQKSEVIINDLKISSGALIVKVTLANGLQKTQKVVLK